MAQYSKLKAVIINIEEYERLKEAYELMEHKSLDKRWGTSQAMT